MVALSPADLKAIERYPLKSALDNAREVLNKTFNYPDFNVPAHLSRLVGATSQLLLALGNHEAAFNIGSISERLNLNTELQRISSRISRDFNYESFLPLIQLVLHEALDIDIWTAVLKLISDFSRRTPPISTVQSSQGTPFRVSSATQQTGSEQTRIRLRQPLQNELSGCTYENTGGFFEKYFEGKAWSKKARDIFQKVKKNHIRGQWKDFPSEPTQDRVWEWWDKFQQKHLQNAPAVYYTTENKAEVTGTQSDRQLDILLKHRNVPAAGKHHAKHYRVMGELTVSTRTSTWKAKFLQLATYMRDVFSVQPLRRFVHGFLFFGTVMELMVFDRSGVYCSKSFDIHNDPERFVQVIAGYAFMSDEELGLDNSLKQTGNFLSIKVTQDSKELSLALNPKPIAIQRAIVTRGTCCYLSQDGKAVVKFSWASAHRRPEADHLISAHADGVKGVPRLLGSRTITEIGDLRSGLTFSKKRKLGGVDDEKARPSGTSGSSFTSQATGESQSLKTNKRKSESAEGQSQRKKSRSSGRSALHREIHAENVVDCPSQATKEMFRNRVLTCLAISPAGRPLSQFRTIRELLEVFRDTIKQHRSLFVEARNRILHRDISENNLIITDPRENDGYSGMLIDYDLAVRVDDVGKNERTEAGVMTGTLEYIAVELLEGALHEDTKGVEHTYRHDLESFLYVFLSICVRYGWDDGKSPKENPLSSWYTGNIESIARTKSGDMESRQFNKYILTKFSPAFECLKDLAMSLRDILFHEGSLYTGTPDPAVAPPGVLYDSMIKAFDDVINSLDKKTRCLKISAPLTEVEDRRDFQYKSRPPTISTEGLPQPRMDTCKRTLEADDELDAKRQRRTPVAIKRPYYLRSKRKAMEAPKAIRRSQRIANMLAGMGGLLC